MLRYGDSRWLGEDIIQGYCVVVLREEFGSLVVIDVGGFLMLVKECGLQGREGVEGFCRGDGRGQIFLQYQA